MVDVRESGCQGRMAYARIVVDVWASEDSGL